MKTCKFCSDICTQESIHEQIIESLIDSSTIEDLLQEVDQILHIATTTANEKAVKLQAIAKVTWLSKTLTL